MDLCLDCGVNLEIPLSGYVSFQQDSPSQFYYEDLEALKQVVNHQTKHGQDEIVCYISNDRNILHSTVKMSHLIARLNHFEIVGVINNGSLKGFIQPIYDIQRNQIFAFESLLRTEKPNIPPMELFDVAQKAGLMSMLDRRAREVAIKTRPRHVQPGIKSFINFLPSTIYNPEHCLKHTFYLVEKYKINPSDLVFEVVETEKIEDVDHLLRIFEEYKKQGIKVALDDLGTGFSTLDILEKLRPDYVKIDRNFVNECDRDSEKQSFLKNVVTLSKELQISVLAEGVERAEELEYCSEIGIQYAQGYFLGRPLPPEHYSEKQFS